MKRVFLFGLAIGTIVALMAGAALAEDHAEITSPSKGENVVENTLQLRAHDTSAADNTVRWAVRYDPDGLDCPAPGTELAGHWMPGFDPEWEGGYFSLDIDISEWDAGKYCFAFNTTLGEADGDRISHDFYIVDHYVKAGGVVTMDDAETVGNGSHAFEGWVADAGTVGLLGQIEVNYRGLRDTCVFEPTTLSLDDNAPGIVNTGQELRAVIGTNADCTDFEGAATFFALDRDAHEPWERGAIVVRPGGSTTAHPYLIDNTPGATGGDSWVPLTHGNVHVISR